MRALHRALQKQSRQLRAEGKQSAARGLREAPSAQNLELTEHDANTEPRKQFFHANLQQSRIDDERCSD